MIITDPSKILELNECLAKLNIDKACAKVEHSLNTIDYKGIFEAPLWTPDYGRQSLVELAQGSLALDLMKVALDVAGAVAIRDLWKRLTSTTIAAHSSFDTLQYVPVDWILLGPALAPPHGLDVLKPPPWPAMPTVPGLRIEVSDEVPRSIRAIGEKSLRAIHEKACSELSVKIESVRNLIAENMGKDQQNIARAAEIAVACNQGDLVAIRTLMLTILRRHPIPGLLAPEESDFTLDVGSRVALCTIEVPDLAKLPIVKKRAN